MGRREREETGKTEVFLPGLLATAKASRSNAFVEGELQ